MSAEFVIRYSFNFRYTKDKRRSIDLPLELFLGKDLDEYTATEMIREDPELMREMLGDQFDNAIEWARLEDWKSLGHQNVVFEIVQK